MSTAASFSKNLRLVCAGSGSDAMSDPRVAATIRQLISTTPRAKNSATDNNINKPPHILYLGTATYDIPEFATRQTSRLQDEHQCTVESLTIATTPPSAAIADSIQRADAIVVGGGNTYFAYRRWQKSGLIPLLQQAAERGCVLTGGSAGAICWFDGGHSDSMDPDSYYEPMMRQFGQPDKTEAGGDATAAAKNVVDESSAPPPTDAPVKDWKYIRVPGLGILPGLLCPHHDRIQSNGVLRAHDFDHMLLTKHPGEVGIGIDHWAALVVDGPDSYRVLSLEGKPGSVLYDSSDNNINTPIFSPEAKGVPGIWIKQVREGKVESRLLPPSGKLSDFLKPATDIIHDEDALRQCRKDNPDPTED